MEAPTSGLPCGSMLLTCSFEAFTFLTCSTWSSTLRFLCMTPAPPSLAISRASRHSVTVSMGDETKGSSSVIFLVRLDAREMSRGSTSLRPGSRMKSRKVKTLEAFFSFETKLNGKVLLSLPKQALQGAIIRIMAFRPKKRSSGSPPPR